MRVVPSLDDVVSSLRRSGIKLPDGNLGLGSFGDSRKLSDCLVELICAGKKLATSSLLWAHEFDGEDLPRVGNIEIVIDYDGSPAAVVCVTAVYALPFDAVPAEFAAAEGEGDGSLAAWRREHWDFFERECRRIGRAAEESMPVVCCEFEVRQVIAGRSGIGS
jgi:uncharacterized protein YhfF